MPPILRLILVTCLIAALLVVAFWFSARKTNAARAQPPTGTTTAKTSPTPPPADPTGQPAPGKSGAPVADADKITDFRAALEEARALRDPRLRSREFGRILRLWLERDLEAALVYLRGLPVASSEYTEGVSMLLETVASKDPERALALAGELAKTRDQLAIYSSLFAQFAQQDVHLAAQRLARVPTGQARENAVRALSDFWVRTDFSAALTWAQGLTEPTDRATALEVVFTELAVKDPLQAIDLAQKSLTGSALDRTVFSALQKLTETDPRAASGLVKLLPPGEMQTLAAVEVARALASQNAEAALAWAKTLPTDAVRSLAMKRALEIWATTDLPAASRYVATLPAGPEQTTAAATLALPLAAADPKNALSWAQALPATETRRSALAVIADTWAQHDASAATRWVAEQPSSTLDTLAPQTLNAALSYWVLQDAVAAQDFVRTLPPASQGGAAAFIAPLLSQTNPTGAIAWAQSLSHPPAREAALAAAYSRWHDNAPAAAQTWLATANLTPETKARLRPQP